MPFSECLTATFTLHEFSCLPINFRTVR